MLVTRPFWAEVSVHFTLRAVALRNGPQIKAEGLRLDTENEAVDCFGDAVVLDIADDGACLRF
jgi:hypothetical protein